MRVPLTEILAYGDNGARVYKTQAATVARYIRMAETTQPPPVVLAHDGTLLDGCHRVAAALARGAHDIVARWPITPNRDRWTEKHTTTTHQTR